MSKLSKFFKTPGLYWRDFFNKRYPDEAENLQVHLKPIDRFDFDGLVDELRERKVTAVFYKPLNQRHKPAICVLENDRKFFFNALYNYRESEGIEVKLKINGKMYTPKSMFDLNRCIKNLKSVDVRLSTDRIFGESLARFWFKVDFWQKKSDFYISPVNNYISRKLWLNVALNHSLFKSETINNLSSILNENHENHLSFDVDLVFTWVNSDDPEWKSMFEKFSPGVIDDASNNSRFLSRDELKFSLRSWFYYGNFINNIYIVSNCKPPEWLNTEHENIHWVPHEDIISSEYLPTFSSHSIEASLHNIEGLSNHFIYCNDDVFLGRPASAEDFYYSNGICKIRLEPYGNVNGEINQEHPDYLNAARNSQNLLEKEFNKTAVHLHTHSPHTLRVDVLKEMNSKFKVDFDRTISNKFRTINDINVTSFFAPHYAVLSGRALNSEAKTDLIQQQNFDKKFKDLLIMKEKGQTNRLPLSFCINDGGDSHLNPLWNEGVIDFLDDFFPDKSDFEN